MPSSSFKFVTSSMLGIIAIIYIVTMIAEQRKFSFALATFFALIIMLVAINIDALQELSTTHTGTMACVWFLFFVVQVVCITYVFVVEDLDKEGWMHRIWIELDGLVAVMTLAVVLHHINMLCRGGARAMPKDATPAAGGAADYVAIPVGRRTQKTRRLKGLAF